MNHKTVLVVIDGVEVEIDSGIAPMVVWLNSFQSVRTLWSCEGEEDEPRLPPYISMRCGSIDDLRAIVGRLSWSFGPAFVIHLVTTTVDWHEGDLRYFLRFRSKSLLQMFQEQNLEVFNESSTEEKLGDRPA